MTSTIPVPLSEWSSFGPLEGEHLDDDPAVQALAEQLSRSGQLTVADLFAKGIAFHASSYVGRVRVGRFLVSIKPKLEGFPLLRLLRYAYGLRDLSLYSRAEFGIDELTFADILLHQLAAEAEELLARGLHRSYERRGEDLQTPRGRINILAFVRRAPRCTTTVPCTHFPRLEDTLLNQALLGGLRFGCGMTDSFGLRSRLRRVAAQMADNVSGVRPTLSTMARAETASSRLTRAYEPALRLIRLLLEGAGMGIEGGQPEMPLPGFLFDMNRFFQALLGRFLRENLPGWSVQEEHRLHNIMRYVPGHNPRNRRAPTPRPDFAITRRGHEYALLDAKYIDLWENRLPQDALYQLSLYAMADRGKGPGGGGPPGKATILYPLIGDPEGRQQRPEQRIELMGPITHERRAEVILRSVNLRHIDHVLAASPSTQAEKRKQAYARRMAFGEKPDALQQNTAIGLAAPE